jgi:hypothetical protein
MDNKLYKTIKQLIKLGIITKNTKIIKRKKKRNRNINRSINQKIYTQSGDNGKTTTNIIANGPTVQSEQAILNLRASELQLENALRDINLPDSSKKKVNQAIEDIQRELKFQNETIRQSQQAFYYLDSKINNNRGYTRYDDEEDTNDNNNMFVPQTKKPSTALILQGNKNNVNSFVSPKNIIDITEDNPSPIEPSPIEPSSIEPLSMPIIPQIEPLSKPIIEEVKPKKQKNFIIEDVDEPIKPVINDKKKDTKISENEIRRNRIKELQKEDANEPVYLTVNQIREKRIKDLQKEYSENGGKNDTFLKGDQNIIHLKKEIKQLKDLNYLKDLKKQYKDNGGTDIKYTSEDFKNLKELDKEVNKLLKKKIDKK